MDKLQKARIKKYISWICLVALIAGLAVMPLMATKTEETDGPKLSILSNTVKNASITTGIKGGGTLTSQKAEKVMIPSGVKITEFLVKNNDTVKAGDPLATVDRVSVMNAITSVQETMDYLLDEMDDADDEAASTKVIAQAGGLVKIIYARVGEQVQDVMLRDGALAVLSLDGLMAVDIPCESSLITGDPVTVMLDDGSEINGRVDSNMEGILSVTIEDDHYEVGAAVTVSTADGEALGSGQLYVHNAWKAVAYTGTISKINTSVNKDVSSGTNLITLKDTDFKAQKEYLLSQYADYEELMLDLFRMYQSTVITAPCDGMISGVDEESIHLLSSMDFDYTLSLLANAPNGNDDITYTNFVGVVTGMESGNWNLSMNPQELSIADYTNLSGVPLDTGAMTKPTAFVPMAPIYELAGSTWIQIQASSVSVGDILLFACDESGNFVWVVRIRSNAEPEDPQPPVPPETTLPLEPEDPSQPTVPPTEPPTEPTVPQNPSFPSFPNTPNFPSWGGQYGNMMPGGFQGGMQQQESFQLFDLEGSLLMTVTPGETMTFSIAVDQQDIQKIHVGMKANIQIAPLKNKAYTAAITRISQSGTSKGGSSKFTVELSLPRQDNMLAGMSVTASIPLFTTENVPVVPVEALVDIGSKTYVYTGYDEKKDTLINPVEVTLGVSDGIVVEIRSGLKPGDTYWYAYYDTLELDTSVDSGFSFS